MSSVVRTDASRHPDSSLGSQALPTQATRAGSAPGNSDLGPGSAVLLGTPSLLFWPSTQQSCCRLPLAQGPRAFSCINVRPLSRSSYFQRGFLEDKTSFKILRDKIPVVGFGNDRREGSFGEMNFFLALWPRTQLRGPQCHLQCATQASQARALQLSFRRCWEPELWPVQAVLGAASVCGVRQPWEV